MNLQIKNLTASVENKEILKKVSLTLEPGKIIALMGPNGSGKSTLAQVLMGHPSFKIDPKSTSSIKIGNEEIKDLSPDKRARLGLFLAFQNPVSVPGVNVANLLRTAKIEAERKTAKKSHNPALNVIAFHELLFKETQKLNIAKELLKRGLNEDFSGGEKKKLEMLQAIILNPKFAVFDEIDTGLDVDALKIVASGISNLKKKGCGILVITHYQRILKYVKPDYVYILVNGKIKEKGTAALAKIVENSGYKKWLSSSRA